MTVWRKSSYSQTGGTTDCVELADLGPHIGLRDSKSPTASHLSMTRPAFAHLIRTIKQQ